MDRGLAHVIDYHMHRAVLELAHTRREAIDYRPTRPWNSYIVPGQSDIEFDYEKERQGDAQ